MDETEEPTPRKKSRSGWYGLAVLFVLVALGFGGVAGLRRHGRRSAVPFAARFQFAFDRGEYQAARALGTADWRARVPDEEFQAFGKTVRGVLGACEATLVETLKLQGVLGSTAVLVCRAKFTHGRATVTYTLKRRLLAWALHDLAIVSLRFRRALTCPHCGFENEHLGPHCAKCRGPMPPPAPPDGRAETPP